MTSYYSVGTVTLVTGSKTVSGNGTAWQTALITGGNIIVEAAGNVLPIATVVDDDTITAELAWTGASGTYNYAIQRDTAYLKTLDTNSQNLAYLLSELRQGTIFKYDVAGPDSDRSIYDTRAKGFAYLSTDGTNPQLYVKLSATSGDWAGPFAYGTGPVGPAPTLAVAATNTLSPGTSATVSITGSDGDYDLTFGIPAGLTGINNRGTYSAGTAYALRDGVLYNGSYWYATQATTGNAPPASASTTSNTWWQLVAAKGTDGTGTGDVVGPSGAVDGRVAAFSGTTGKLLADGGKLVADLVTGPSSATANQLASFSSTTGKVIADSGLLVSDVSAGIAGNVKFNGSQTLTAAEQGRARANVDAGIVGGFRNKIINGNFDIWQRATSQTTSGYGSDDRWNNSNVGSSKTHSQQAFTAGQTSVPGNPLYFSRTVVSSVAGASNLVLKYQSIESVRTCAGMRCTLTFWAKADASRPIAIELFQNFGTGGTPSSTVFGIGAQKVQLTTSWQKFSIAIDVPSIAGKTLGTTNDGFLGVIFWFDAGSSFDSRAASLGQQSGTFDLARVSFVHGDATLEADPSAIRHIEQERELANYYFRVATAIPVSGFSTTVAVATLDMSGFPMRATPACSLNSAGALYGNSASITPSSIGSVGGNASGVFFDVNATGLTASAAYNWRNCRVYLDAEL